MQYVYIVWMYKGEKFAIAHKFPEPYSAKDIAAWMRYQLDDVKHPIFAFEEISEERYNYYYKRKLTTENFEGTKN